MRVRAGTTGGGRARLGRRVGAGAACLLLAAFACLDRPGVGALGAGLTPRPAEGLAPPAAAPARVSLGPDGVDIRLAGELGEGTAQRLRALLDAHPRAGRLHLTSEGGLVEEGQAIGDLVAARNLATYVPDYCVSACTLAFVRGTRRFLVEGGRLGFHAPYELGALGGIVQMDGTPERAAYLAAGLDPAFVGEALATASADLWVPDAARLLAAGAVTEMVGTDRFPDSTLDDDPSPAGARAAVLRVLPLLGSAPGAVDGLAAWYAEAYRAGRSEAESVAGLRRRVAAGIARGLAQADAPTLLSAGRILLRAMLAARDGDRALCARIGAGTDLVEAGEVLGDGAEVPALVARAGLVAVIEPLPDDAVLAPRACATEIHAYARALAKPPAEAALAVRALVQRTRRPVREASALP